MAHQIDWDGMLLHRNLSFIFRSVKSPLVLLTALMAATSTAHADSPHRVIKIPSSTFYPYIAFSHDGKMLVGLGGSKKGDWRINFWDAHSLTLVKSQTVAKDIDGGVLSPDFKKIAVPNSHSGDYDYLIFYNATTGPMLWRIPISGIDSIAFSPDGDTIATGESLGHNNSSHLWHACDGKSEPLFLSDSKGMGGEVLYSLAFSPDGSKVVGGSQDGDIGVVNARSHKMLWIQRAKQLVLSVGYSSSGNLVASGSYDQVRLWNAQNGRLLHTMQTPTKWVSCLKFSPDSRILASGSKDGFIVLNDAQSGKQLRVLKSRSVVRSLDFSPDGSRLVASYEDGSIILWRIQ